MTEKASQTTSHILMVRPANFGYNEETAASNAFQMKDATYLSSSVREKARIEFDQLVGVLRTNGVNVIVADDSDAPVKPDAVFPNNWVTFHENGTVITYPMHSLLRRLERQQPILDMIGKKFEIQAVFNLEKYENESRFLEGTGSLILDRINKIAYACLSPRTDSEILDVFCKLTGYKKLSFNAADQKGQLIYHTNVMMALGHRYVVICLETVKDTGEMARLRKSFESTGKVMLVINYAQMNAFAGNMLQIESSDGEKLLVMSTQAYRSLNAAQISLLERYNRLIHSDISTIEKYGGGSARCMMAEVFLPLKS